MCLETILCCMMSALPSSVRMDEISNFSPVVTDAVRTWAQYIGCISVTVCVDMYLCFKILLSIMGKWLFFSTVFFFGAGFSQLYV